MTFEKMIALARQWDTEEIYHEISFNFIEGTLNWTISQQLFAPRNWQEVRHPHEDVANGTGVESLVDFVKSTHPEWHGFKTKLYKATERWNNPVNPKRNPQAGPEWVSKQRRNHAQREGF